MDEIVTKAKEHLFSSTPFSYPDDMALTEQWSTQREKTRQAILGMRTVEDVITWAQKIENGGFNHRMQANPSGLRKQMDMFLKRWPNKQNWFTRHESPFSRPETLAWTDGCLVSNIWFWHMEALMRVFDLQPIGYRVLEIGGGLGELAVLAQRSRSFLWQIIDIPESLFFAEVFVRANHVPVLQPFESGEMSLGYVQLLPIHIFNSLSLQTSMYDVIISQGSLQEMQPKTVARWWNMINKSRASYFLSINGKATAIPWSSTEWDILYQEHNTPDLQVVLDSGADFEELVLKRKIVN